jgi:phosphatidylglycerophosphate synthase
MQASDVYVAVGMFLLLGGVVAVYATRAFSRGRARHSRSDADGGSVLLSKVAMEMGYWLLDPVVSVLATWRVTPNAVTMFSLVPAALAAVAVAFGCFGLGCALGTLGALCDLVDGVLARRTGVDSEAGEVFDAATDRYIEFLFLAGTAVYYRTHWMVLVLTLAAMLGSFMISYTTAKAEAMGVRAPRGPMRRAERAVYLLTASALTAVTKVLFASSPSHALRELPLLVALALVAVVTNVSAVQRFAVIAGALRSRGPALPSPGDNDGIIVESDRPVSLVQP